MSSCIRISKFSCHRCHIMGDNLLERGNCAGHCYWPASIKSQGEAFPEIPQALTRDLPPKNSDPASVTGGRLQSTTQQLSDSTESCHGGWGNALALAESTWGIHWTNYQNTLRIASPLSTLFCLCLHSPRGSKARGRAAQQLLWSPLSRWI